MWPFKSCKCSQELSQSENQAIIAAEFINNDQIEQLTEELRNERRNSSHFMDLYHTQLKEIERLQRMCTELTESVKRLRDKQEYDETYGTPVMKDGKPTNIRRVPKRKEKTEPVSIVYTRGHIPEVMD